MIPPTPGNDPVADHLEVCRSLNDQATDFVTVLLVEAEGSVPQDVGSRMVVTTQGRVWGTVGGGRVEAKAIQVAQQFLAGGDASRLVQWNLNTDIGMTCGGRLRLFFDVTRPRAWKIVVFGAGHVAQSLTRLLRTLPCHVTCVDSRAEWLLRLPDGVQRVELEEPADFVDQVAAGTYVVSMTQGHARDLPVLVRLATSGLSYPYIGVIGSKSKAAALRRELRQAGVADDFEFRCPIGLPLGTNHPGEIAVSITAELIRVRDLTTA